VLRSLTSRGSRPARQMSTQVLSANRQLRWTADRRPRRAATRRTGTSPNAVWSARSCSRTRRERCRLDGARDSSRCWPSSNARRIDREPAESASPKRSSRAIAGARHPRRCGNRKRRVFDLSGSPPRRRTVRVVLVLSLTSRYGDDARNVARRRSTQSLVHGRGSQPDSSRRLQRRPPAGGRGERLADDHAPLPRRSPRRRRMAHLARRAGSATRESATNERDIAVNDRPQPPQRTAHSEYDVRACGLELPPEAELLEHLATAPTNRHIAQMMFRLDTRCQDPHLKSISRRRGPLIAPNRLARVAGR
jgi:hypothetical protein